MITFSVPGDPRGKERAGRSGDRSFTPKQTLLAEREVLRVFRRTVGPSYVPDWRALRVTITATFEIPASWSPKLKAYAMLHRIPFTSKPDKDNIEKLVYDALNEWAWVDDCQCGGGLLKYYGAVPRLDITIRPEDDRTEPMTGPEKARVIKAAGLHDNTILRRKDRPRKAPNEQSHKRAFRPYRKKSGPVA